MVPTAWVLLHWKMSSVPVSANLSSTMAASQQYTAAAMQTCLRLAATHPHCNGLGAKLKAATLSGCFEDVLRKGPLLLLEMSSNG